MKKELKTTIESLEKENNKKSLSNYSDEDVEKLKSTIVKLYEYIKINEMFTMENKDSQIKYLNELISILESNKDFTDTIDTIMYEFYIKNNKNSNSQDSNELVANNFENVSQSTIKIV